MRMNAVRLGLGLAVLCALVLSGRAEEKKEEKKEVTLKGTITCAKCDLKETDKCMTAIKTKIDDKDVTVYFKDEGKKEKYHPCQAAKKGSVTGEIVEDKEVKGKKWIVPAKEGVKFD